MKHIMSIMLVKKTTGMITVRDVELPVDQALARPRVPQHICTIPKDCYSVVLGVEAQED